MQNKFFGFILGLAAGALVGSAAALLFAPASGEELRQGVVDRYTTVRADVIQAAADRRAQLEEELKALRAPRKSGVVEKVAEE